MKEEKGKRLVERLRRFGGHCHLPSSVGLTGRAGNLGGAIRHPEIEMSAPQGPGETGEAAGEQEKGGEKETGGEDD